MTESVIELNDEKVLNDEIPDAAIEIARGVTIAATSSGLACIAIGACDSVRWLA
jgi:hypothetical protein